MRARNRAYFISWVNFLWCLAQRPLLSRLKTFFLGDKNFSSFSSFFFRLGFFYFLPVFSGPFAVAENNKVVQHYFCDRTLLAVFARKRSIDKPAFDKYLSPFGQELAAEFGQFLPGDDPVILDVFFDGSVGGGPTAIRGDAECTNRGACRCIF